MSFDLSVFNFLFSFIGRSRFLDFLGIFFAEYFPYILIILTVFLFLKEKNWKKRIYFFSLVILSLILSRGIITESIRFFYQRPRPFAVLNINSLLHDSDPSFPSGHSSAYFALAFAVYYINKKWGRWFLFGALLMGIARVFVGVHWPTDILGGIIIAFISVLIIKKILPKSYN